MRAVKVPARLRNRADSPSPSLLDKTLLCCSSQSDMGRNLNLLHSNNRDTDQHGLAHFELTGAPRKPSTALYLGHILITVNIPRQDSGGWKIRPRG